VTRGDEIVSGVGKQIAVAEHDALRPAGRPTRIRNRGQSVGRNRVRLVNLSPDQLGVWDAVIWTLTLPVKDEFPDG
jgi:hypothetical protein